MFGYVLINKPELKIREFDEYRNYYCGLCRALKRDYGFLGQMTLTYDMTFMVLLLTGLYEPETNMSCTKCVAHPIKKHNEKINRFSYYASDMSIILTYYKCLDDWNDERKLKKLILAKLLEGKAKRISKKYPEKAEVIKDKLKELSDYEAANEKSIDIVAGVFGHIMAEIFIYEDDIWKETLWKMGFFLGKFIYILDAYEDAEEDIKKENYNPLSDKFNEDNFDEEAEKILTMMMAECSREFELLPVLENVEILRNILYAGVWNRFDIVKQKKLKEKIDE